MTIHSPPSYDLVGAREPTQIHCGGAWPAAGLFPRPAAGNKHTICHSGCESSIGDTCRLKVSACHHDLTRSIGDCWPTRWGGSRSGRKFLLVRGKKQESQSKTSKAQTRKITVTSAISLFGFTAAVLLLEPVYDGTLEAEPVTTMRWHARAIDCWNCRAGNRDHSMRSLYDKLLPSI